MGGSASQSGQADPEADARLDTDPLPTSFSLERAYAHCGRRRTVAAGRYRDARSGGRGLLDDFEADPDSLVLGRGSNVEVVSIVSRSNGRRYALKTFFKGSKNSEELGLLVNELEIYLGLDHPHVVRLEGVYETEEELHLVMESCEGGELYDQLRQRGPFPEAQAASVARQVLRAVGYLHSRGITHRDLKLENLLFEHTGRSSPLKLADFGLAWARRPTSPKMRRCCGSPEYVAPEVLSLEGYTSQCDLWGLGVVVFMLISGQAPFPPSPRQLERVREGAIDWSSSERWSQISNDGLDFVQRLLVTNPEERMDAQQAIFHPWLLRLLGNHVSVPTLDSKVLSSFRSYASASRLRRVVLQMAAQHIPLEEVAPLRNAFLGLDLGNEGVIQVRDLRATLCGQNAPMELDELLAAIDAVSDEGGISYSEFLAAASQAVGEEAAVAAFRRLDASGRGSVDAGDLEAAFRSKRGASSSTISTALLDANDDSPPDRIDSGIVLAGDGDSDGGSSCWRGCFGAAELLGDAGVYKEQLLSGGGMCFDVFMRLLRGEGPSPPPAASASRSLVAAAARAAMFLRGGAATAAVAA